MNIILNGSEAQTSAETIGQLLVELGLSEKPVVIEHNQKALLKSEHQDTRLVEGDALEVITLAAGG